MKNATTEMGSSPESIWDEAKASTKASTTPSGNAQTQDRNAAGNLSTTEKLAAAAHSAIDSFEHKAADAEQVLRGRAEQLASQGTDASEQAQDIAAQAKTTALQYVEDKPVQSLAIAFGVGALIATLLRK